METKTIFNADQNTGSIYIMKVFAVKPSSIWNHFTQANLLEKWWAPEPYKCETVEMNFSPNGVWKFLIVSPDPEDEKQNSVLKYNEINEHRSFDFTENIIYQKGENSREILSGNWLVGVTGVEEGTKLTINIQYNSPEELAFILEMNFEENFTKVLNQLEDLLQK
jgi:uncharacterized protein YndB with AHSA1/START domain